MDRAQAYTLEGTIAAIIVVIAALYGIQAIDAGPWSDSTAQQSDRYSTQAANFLSVTAANGSLGDTVRCYGSSKPSFNGGAIDDESSHFEQQLNHSYDRQGTDYNLYASYWTRDDGRETVVLSSADPDSVPAPGDDAGSATHRIALYDDDRVKIQSGGTDCTGDGPEISELSDFYVPDVNEDSMLYNVVEVRLVVW